MSSSTAPPAVSDCHVALEDSVSSCSKERPETEQMARTASLVAPTTLEPSLLHGITTQTLLRRCAIAFRSQEFNVAQHYSKSFETESLDDFISHDWSSSRFDKLMALCLVYNSQAAMVASTMSSVVVMLLQRGPDPILPPPRFAEHDEVVQDAQHLPFWNAVAGPLVFIIFFLFWQDLRALLRFRRKTCFLDKYCIDQGNPERKSAGILGLAGFLRCSERIIILWAPRYFTRLWCTYEVASWLHLNKPLASVCFVPLAHADIVTTLWTLHVLQLLMVALVKPFYPEHHLYFVFSWVFLANCWTGHKARRCAQNLRAMKDQLMNFAVTDAKCFCCTSNHITATGEAIPCDRQDDDHCHGLESCLDKFNQAVRTRFAEQVLQKVGPTQLPYRYVIIAGWPYFFRMFDMVLASSAVGMTSAVNQTIMYLFFPLATLPLWYKFAVVRLCCWVDLWVGRPRSRVLDLLVSGAVAAAMVVVAGFLYAPWEFVLASSLSPVVMLSIAIGMFAFSCWVYPDSVEYFRECCSCKGRCCGKRRCCHTAPSQSIPSRGHECTKGEEHESNGGSAEEAEETGGHERTKGEEHEGNGGSAEEEVEKEEKEEDAGKGVQECPHELVESDDDIASIHSI